MPLAWAATAHPFRAADPIAVSGPDCSGVGRTPRQGQGRGDAGDHPAEQRMNRTIMQTDPTARHSPIGSFQRVCYLVHLARDGRMAAAPGTRPPALHPDRRRARWEGNRGRGRPVRCRTIPEGVRGKARSPTGLHGGGARAPGRPAWFAPVLTEPPGLAAGPYRPGRSRTGYALAEQLGSVNAAAQELGTT